MGDDDWGTPAKAQNDDWATPAPAQNDDWANSTSTGQDDGWGTSTAQGSSDGWGNSDQGQTSRGGGRGGRGGGRGGGGGGGDRGCFNCGQTGHMSRDCTEPRKAGGGGGGGDRGCFNCGQTGHMSRDCTEPRKAGGRGGSSGGGGGDRSCYNCNGTGHMSRDCPQPRKPRNENQSFRCGGGGSGAKSSSGGDSGWGNSDGGWGSGGGDSKPTASNNDDWGTSDTKKTNDNDDWGNSSKQNNNDDWGGSGDTKRKNTDDDWGSGGGGGDTSQTNGSGPKKRVRREDDMDGDQDNDRPREHYKPEELNLAEEALMQQGSAGINFDNYEQHKVTCIPPDAISPIQKFEDVIKSKLLLTNIKKCKYDKMTPIQKWAMPALMDGNDLIACAQTGSGKTAAFVLPIMQTLLDMELEPHDPNSECQNPYCLIISPTRELANQLYVHANLLCDDSIIKCHVIYGQISTFHLKAKLMTGCHILVATPGRLKDFVERGWIGFKNIKYVILDEGDRLVDEGFTSEIRNFFNNSSMPPSDKRQTLFFSATFNDKTQAAAKEYLKDNFIFLTVGKIGAANENIKQEFLKVEKNEKKRELKKILEQVPETDKVIIFTQTKQLADILAGFFSTLKLPSTSIHGDRLQSQREEAIRHFKKGEKRFLISSPVGNRGLDLPKVALVINYDMPKSIDEYVHRIGRTGRAGHTGRAISFFDSSYDSELLPELIDILTEAKQEIPDWMQGSSGSGDNGGFGSSAFNDGWDAPAPAAQSTNQTSLDEDWGETSTNNCDQSAKNDNQTDDNKPEQNNAADDGW